MMLNYLADRCDLPSYADAALLVEAAVEAGFAANTLRPMEFGCEMGTRAVTAAVIDQITGAA